VSAPIVQKGILCPIAILRLRHEVTERDVAAPVRFFSPENIGVGTIRFLLFRFVFRLVIVVAHLPGFIKGAQSR
jgi:hypothetical protein